jgi:hypothetical protein
VKEGRRRVFSSILLWIEREGEGEGEGQGEGFYSPWSHVYLLELSYLIV